MKFRNALKVDETIAGQKISTYDTDMSHDSQNIISTKSSLMNSEHLKEPYQLQIASTKDGLLPRVEIEFAEAELKRNITLPLIKQSVKIRKVKEMSAHESNHVLSLADRLQILYLHRCHHLSMGEIAKIVDKKYSTIRSIILTFEKTGRINKLLTLSAKRTILESRAHSRSLKSTSTVSQTK